jgi:hypothetical protein
VSKNQYPLGPDVLVSDIFFRTLAGAFGGVFGSAVILVGLFVSSSIADNALVAETGSINPLFTFIAIVIIYLAILISALSSQTFFYFTNRDKYQYLLSTLSHSFAVITLIFLAATPLTLLISLESIEMISIVGLIELGIASVFCMIVQESVAQSKHILLTLYSTSIALFFFLLISLILFFAVQTTSFLVLLAFPIAWASLGFWQVSLEMAYQWMYSLYGNDFLNKETRVGSDYIKASRN